MVGNHANKKSQQMIMLRLKRKKCFMYTFYLAVVNGAQKKSFGGGKL